MIVACIKSTNFCMLIVCPVTLLIVFTKYKILFCKVFVFFNGIVFSVNNDTLTSSFPILSPLYLCLVLISVAKTLSSILSWNGVSRHFVSIWILVEMLSIFHVIIETCYVIYRFVIYCFYFEICFIDFLFIQDFYHEVILNIVK